MTYAGVTGAGAHGASESVVREEISGMRGQHASLKKKDTLLAQEMAAAFERLEKMVDGVKEMALEIAMGEKEIKMLHGVIASNRAKRMDVSHLENLAREFEKLDVASKELDESHARMTGEVLKMESGFKEMRLKLPYDEDSLKRVSAEVEVLAAEKAVIAPEVSRLEEAAGVFLEMEKLRAESQSLEKEFQECTDVILKTEKLISETEPITVGLRDRVKSLSAELRELQERNKEIIRLKDEKTVVEKAIATGQAEYQSKMNEIQSLQRQLEEKSGMLAKIESENQGKRKQYELAAGETARLDKEIGEYKAALAIHAELAKKRETLLSQVHKALITEAELETGMSRLGQMMRSMVNKVEESI